MADDLTRLIEEYMPIDKTGTALEMIAALTAELASLRAEHAEAHRIFEEARQMWAERDLLALEMSRRINEMADTLERLENELAEARSREAAALALVGEVRLLLSPYGAVSDLCQSSPCEPWCARLRDILAGPSSDRAAALGRAVEKLDAAARDAVAAWRRCCVAPLLRGAGRRTGRRRSRP